MSWFTDWFDSPLYEKLYAHRDDNEAAELGELLSVIIPVEQYPTVLDLGCGRGRHSINLGVKGYSVTGVDLSPNAIEQAQNIANQKGLSNVSFEVMDMRNCLDKEFDAAVNLFTTFGYFEKEEENLSVLRNVAAMLRPGGRFVLDYLNAPLVAQDYVPSDDGVIDSLNYSIRRWIENGFIKKEIKFRTNGEEEPFVFTERVKLYDLEWFSEKLQDSGFRILDTFGNYEGSKYSKKDSSRLIILAEKAG